MLFDPPAILDNPQPPGGGEGLQRGGSGAIISRIFHLLHPLFHTLFRIAVLKKNNKTTVS